MASLDGKQALLGVTGGIAAYKSAELIRLLQRAGAEVKVVMTESAKEFITPLTLETLSGHPVYCDMFQSRNLPATHHISLARWTDMVLIAPATANFIARVANGFANDLLSTICLSTEAEIILAPAMNRCMWHNKITQQNVSELKNRHYKIIGPEEGEQACGEIGIGRMTEPEEILKQLVSPKSLSGKKDNNQLSFINGRDEIESKIPTRTGRLNFCSTKKNRSVINTKEINSKE